MLSTWLSYFLLCFSNYADFSSSASEKDYISSKQSHVCFPNSNKIAITYTWDNDKIVQRQAFAYTPEGAIAIVVTDDGSDKDINDLKNVTFRKIENFIPNNKAPLGIPSRIEEKVVDLATGNKLLVTAKQNYFSKEGRLIKQEIFDANNQLVSTYKWDYDQKGRMTFQVDPLGNEIIWGYDERDNRIFEKKGDVAYNIEYDSLGRAIRRDEIHGDIVLTTLYRYDTQGRVVNEIDPYGNETNYIYNLLGQLIQVIEPEVEDEDGKLVRPITMYSYNKDGQKIQTIDPKGNVTKYTYLNKDQKNPSQILYEDGSIEQFEYNSLGDVTKQIKNGITTVIERDFKGRVTKVQNYSSQGRLLNGTEAKYSAFFLLSEIDGDGKVTQYEYDSYGRKNKKICENVKVSFEYDSQGRVIKETREFGENDSRNVYFAYDAANNITEEREEDRFGNLLKGKKSVYNSEGLPVQITQIGPKGAANTFIEYDSFGMKTTKDPFGNITKEQIRHGCKNELGKNVRCFAITDPSGVETTIVQDALHRDKEITKIQTNSTQHLKPEILHRIEYAYDVLGNLIHEKNVVYSGNENKKKFARSYQFDAMNRCVKTIEGSNTGSPKITKYSYNKLGKKSLIEKPSGKKIFYVYSDEGLLLKCYASDDSNNYSFSYDDQSRLIKIEDKNAPAHCLEYDAKGRLIKETLPNGNQISYEYDLKGIHTSKTLTDGSKILYNYENGLLRSVDRISVKGDLLYTHSYDKYIAGFPVEETLLDRAGKVFKNYTKDGKLCSIESTHFKELIPENGWSALGEIVKKTINDCKGAKKLAYAYNFLGNIVEENEHSYVYNSLGDIQTKDSIAYVYNNLNQLTKVGNRELKYDEDGNLIFDGILKYSYDAFNRLTSIKTDKWQAFYTYDAFNRRLTTKIEKFKGQHSCSYLYDGNVEIGSFCDGIPQEICISGLDSSVAIELKGEPYTPIVGSSGSVQALLTRTGHLLEGCRYSSKGEEEVFDVNGRTKNPINPWRYLQKRFDKESGLYYMDGRFYSPALGIFITKEPIACYGT